MSRRWNWLGVLASLALVLGVAAVPAGAAQAEEIGDSAVSVGAPTRGWSPADGIVFSMVQIGDVLIMGGSFTSMVHYPTKVTAPRSRLAAINVKTGALLPWTPAANSTVYALAASPDNKSVFVGGAFNRIGTASRVRLAEVSVANGAVTSFAIPAPNGTVRALNLYRGSLYVGGSFWKVGAAKRAGGMALDPNTGAIKGWNPQTDNGIYAIAPAADNSGIFIGGPFKKMDLKPRPHLAKVTVSTGATINSFRFAMAPVCDDEVKNPCDVLSLATDATHVYAALAGPGGHLVSLNATTGARTFWKVGDGDLQTVIVYGDSIYAGGHFKSFDGATTNPRAGIVGVNRNGAKLPAPTADVRGTSGVHAMLIDGDYLRIAGEFSKVNGHDIPRYTSFRITDFTAPTVPGAPTASATPTAVTLRWGASTDDVSRPKYWVQRDGKHLATAYTTSFVDTTVKPETRYKYTVKSVDAVGNVSAASQSVTVTTPKTTPAKKVTVAVAKAGYGNVLAVNVDPDLGAASYAFHVQKLVGGKWATLKGVYRTDGARETKSIALAVGTYRVSVLAGPGTTAAVSKAIALAPTVKVKLTTDKSRNKLKVDVNPNKGKGFYTFRVQQKVGAKWVNLKSYKTQGSAETRTVNLKKGTYRVVVAGKYGYKGAVSNAAALVK